MKETTTRAVIAALKDCFSRFGNPQKLVSDNGPQFSSFAFREFLEKVNVEHVRCAPLHAQSNGQIERFHRYLNHSLRAAKLQGFIPRERLPQILHIFRATPHAATGRTPAYLLQNREFKTDVPILNFKGSDKDYDKYQECMKDQHDKKLKSSSDLTKFKVGDLVWSLVPQSSKSDPIFPVIVWVVIGIKGDRTYEIVNSTTGNKVIRNASFLRQISFNPPRIPAQIEPSQNLRTQESIPPIIVPTESEKDQKPIEEVFDNKQTNEEPVPSNPVDHSTTEPEVSPPTTSVDKPIERRSNRIRRKPKYLNDYQQY